LPCHMWREYLLGVKGVRASRLRLFAVLWNCIGYKV
jgi:hypothetical protein